MRLLSRSRPHPESTAPPGASPRYHKSGDPVVVVGAGPYGLSAAAHLIQAGVSVRAFGEPMESWAHHMPSGMLLRSRWDASHIADPDHALGLGNYEVASGHVRAKPVPLERFVDYGRWFQERAVPSLEQRRVVHVSPDPNGFWIEIDDGETFRAERVVVAAGIVPFAWRPPQFADLPPEFVSHTVEHRDLGVFEGRRVAVVGGGQSALESAALLSEAGAEAEVLVREPDIRWLPEEDDADLGLLYYANRKIALGGPRSAWLPAWPGLFRQLPNRVHEPLVYHFTSPRGAAWLRPRLSRVPITTGRSVASASPRGDELLLKLSDGSTREVDHLLLATGYRVDLRRYAFLAPELVSRVRTRNGSPVLTNGLESSVRGLHFLGAPAKQSFGPVMNFVCGTWATARGLTRSVVGRSVPRAGFSW
jgi:FAD-dependent urate hydroxylase